MRRILSGFLRVKRDATRTQIGRNTRPTRSALTGQAQRRRPVRAKCFQSQHPQVDRPESFWRGLAFVPAIQWAKRMQETLLDFDNADASGDRGAVIPLNLKTVDKRLRIPEMSAMLREWSMPRAHALVLSCRTAPRLEPGLFGSHGRIVKKRETKRRLSH